MTENENPIEEKKTATTKFAEWLMARQEKKEAKENAENAVKVLNEQAEELAQSLGKLFKGVQKSPVKKNNKYDSNIH